MTRRTKHGGSSTAGKNRRKSSPFSTDGPGPPQTAALPNKATMEEASHAICAECGYGGGRHSTFCGRSDQTS